MIIETQDDVTRAVLQEMHRTPDTRTKEILCALVRHLHQLVQALGVSNLVCLINNGAGGTRPTRANNLGPFFREGAPQLANGASLLRSPTPGPRLSFKGFVRDLEGCPIEGARSRSRLSAPGSMFPSTTR